MNIIYKREKPRKINEMYKENITGGVARLVRFQCVIQAEYGRKEIAVVSKTLFSFESRVREKN